MLMFSNNETNFMKFKFLERTCYFELDTSSRLASGGSKVPRGNGTFLNAGFGGNFFPPPLASYFFDREML